MVIRNRFFVLCVLSLWLPAFVRAQAPSPAGEARTAAPAGRASSPPASIVFVPYEKIAGPKLGAKDSVLLPYAEFLRLKNAAAGKPDSADFKPRASIVQSEFHGSVEGDVAKFDAEFIIEALARPEDALEVRLPFSGASVESAVLTKGAGASIGGPLGKEGGLSLFLRGEGERVLRIRLVAPLRSDGNAKRLDFRVPAAAASSLILQVGEEVTLQPVRGALPASVVALKEGVSALKQGGSEIKAACGSRDRLLLAYRPKVEVTGAAAESRLAVSEEIRLSVSPRSTSAQVGVDVSVLAGRVDAIAFDLPASARLLGVSGPFVKDWRVADQNRRCDVSLAPALSEPFNLTLVLDLDRSASPTAAVGALPRLEVPEFRVVGAARESGRVLIVPDPGLSVWPEEIAGLETVSAKDGGAAARAFRFAQPGWRLVLSRRLTPARVLSDGLILYEVTEEFVRLKSEHRLKVSGRGIFGVTLQVPERFELREAAPSSLVSGYRQDGRLVEVNFRGEQLGDCALNLSLQRSRRRREDRVSGESQIQLEPIGVVGADEDAGNVALAMPSALRAAELESSGLEATDVRTLQDRLRPLLSENVALVLGYRYFRPDFRGLTSIERQRTRLTCETARLVSVMPSLMRVNATLDYNVEFSATDEFHMLVPASAGEDVRFSGADIKEKTRTDPGAGVGEEAQGPREARAPYEDLTTWTIRLQRRILGPYRLGVSLDMPLAGADSGEALNVLVPVVRATKVARETGYVGVSRGESLEVGVSKAEGLEPRDVKELPAELVSAFLGFRYFDPQKQLLELKLVRHELEGVLGALIRRMHVDTVLSDQREAVHEIFFEVQNNREPYLELRLPEGMQIWAAFVRGAPVRPTIRRSDGARLIELIKSEGWDKAFRLRLILRETLPGGDMGILGKLVFKPPEPINMDVLRLTWKLYLPAKYRYVSFGGTMRQDLKGAPSWIEPAAESLLNDLPASLAGGIAQPTRRPPQSRAPAQYGVEETEEEKRARLQGAALDIPIVREGSQFEFSMLSGIGFIETNYWRTKALILLQGAAWLALFALVAVAMWRQRQTERRFAVGAAATAVAFIAASLTEGLAGRLCATALVAAGAALALGLLAYAIARSRPAITHALGAAREARGPSERKRRGDRVSHDDHEPKK
ncbi:MAG TPA: hypothetical protein VM492_05085 [Sumerlaeia bacterium]|nr:hypothetical protein [Sumerlaeia bacterium]